MKKLEIIIRPEKLENLKAILEGCRVNGIMISNVMGYGNQKGYTQMRPRFDRTTLNSIQNPTYTIIKGDNCLPAGKRLSPSCIHSRDSGGVYQNSSGGIKLWKKQPY